MRFQLAGPNALAYLPDAPLKAAVESLERAHAILVGGAWRVRKCEDLWTQHSLQPYTGYERWDDERKFCLFHLFNRKEKKCIDVRCDDE